MGPLLSPISILALYSLRVLFVLSFFVGLIRVQYSLVALGFSS